MKRESFNAGWEVVTVQKDFPFGTTRTRVTLPYDDLLNAERTPDAPGGAATGYYPDRTATYEKKFFVPEEWEEQKVVLEFEGVYSHSMVMINREYAGGCSHGYTNFLVPADGFLKYGEENEIKVISRTAADSRWYNGAGIYRSVNLLRGNGSYLTPYGLRITTAEADGEGAVRWSPEFPYLYTVRAEVRDAGGKITDCEEIPFGIRTLAADAGDPEDFDREQAHAFSGEAASQCAVLLKNETVGEQSALPLQSDEKVLFIGAFAAKPRYQGAGSSHINVRHPVSALECTDGLPVTFAQGYDPAGESDEEALLGEAVCAAREADAAVDLLYGKVNPSGHLAETWPVKLSDNPSYLNFPGEGGVVEYREGIYIGYRYYDKKGMDVLFPFGHGLSYTSFAYSDLAFDREQMTDGGTVTVTCRVKNTGPREGAG